MNIIEPITAKERALMLFNKYSKDYNRRVCMGKQYQTEHWKEVTKELGDRILNGQLPNNDIIIIDDELFRLMCKGKI